METDRHYSSDNQNNDGDFQLCELMTDSVINETTSQLQQIKDNNEKVPSIIKNLEQEDSTARISQIIVAFSCDLYQQQMKTIQTLGIIPEQKSYVQSCTNIQKKLKTEQDDLSTKFNTSQDGQTIHKLDSYGTSCFRGFPRSQVNQTFVIFKLKQSSNPNKAFSLFRNYLLRNKLQIINDSFNMIIAKIKQKSNNFSTFFQSLKLSQDHNFVNLCLCFESGSQTSLKLSLSAHPRYLQRLHQYSHQLVRHGNNYKQYLWQNNCIEVSQSEAIELTFIKQKDSVLQLKKLIKCILKQNNNQIGLENCLIKILQLRELFMYQIQQKGIVFTKYNPLIELQKKLIFELNFYDIYKQYYQKDQQIYQKRKIQINQQYKLKDKYSYLKIADSDRIVNEDDEQQFPYNSAVIQLDNFLNDPYPHLFLFNIQRFYNSLQLCKQTNGHTSISQMLNGQGQLGLVILCLSQSQVKNVYHKIKFIEHYLRLTDNSKYEQMCLNLSFALDYIERSWQTH